MLLRANKHLQPAGGLTILPDTAGCLAAAREQRQDVGGSTLSARPRAAQTGDFPLYMNLAGRRSRGAVIFREVWAWQEPRPPGFWDSTSELFAWGNLPRTGSQAGSAQHIPDKPELRSKNRCPVVAQASRLRSRASRPRTRMSTGERRLDAPAALT